MDGKETINMCQVQLLYYHSHNHSLTHPPNPSTHSQTHSHHISLINSFTLQLTHIHSSNHLLAQPLLHSLAHPPILHLITAYHSSKPPWRMDGSAWWVAGTEVLHSLQWFWSRMKCLPFSSLAPRCMTGLMWM